LFARFTVYEVESLDCEAQDTSKDSPLVAANGNSFLAVIPEGPHPIPSRTRKLRPPGPMVLQGELCGRVGRRQELFLTARAKQLARAVSIFCIRNPGRVPF